MIAALTVNDPETGRPVFVADEHVQLVAEQAIGQVTQARAHFRASHVDTAVSTTLKGYRFTTSDELAAAHTAVLNHAMTAIAVPLTPPEPLTLPTTLTATSGRGIDRPANSEKFTTHAVLDAETTVLDGARNPVAVFATEADLAAAEKAHEAASGWSLNAGQHALAQHLVTAGTLVAAGVGPAGTGKTASMTIVARTWQATGRKVIGLAPSAAAASVLSEDIDAPAHTIDALTFTWRGLHPTEPGKTLSALPIAINPGDMPGYFLAGFDQAAELIDEVAAPNLGLQFDAYHAHQITGDVIACWDRHAARVRHIQIAGAPGRHEPKGGEINFAEFFRRVDASGYRGWVGAEYMPATTPEAGLRWLREGGA